MSRASWRTAFIVVSLVFMAGLLVQQGSRIRGLNLQIDPGLLTLAFASLIALFFLDALGWHLILRTLGAEISPRDSIRIWLVSSLARYLPGGMWGFVSRATFCSEHGIALTTSSLSLYLETLLLCAGALAAGFPAVASAAGFVIDPRTAILLMVALALLLHPRVLGWLRFLPGAAGRAFADARLPGVPKLLLLYLYYVCFWAAFGLVFLGFVRAIVPVPPQASLPVAASMGMSFAIGFVAVFAPGGIGVRESALYVLLRPYLPDSACLLVAVTSRFWIMLGECVSVAIAVTLMRAPAATAKPGRSG